MAKEDYVVADRALEGENGALTAGERVNQTVYATPEDDHADFIEDSGQNVSRAAYVDYAEALEAHQSRPDIETLADRRAREYGADFDAGSFMRAPAGDEAPTSGSVHGTAPASE